AATLGHARAAHEQDPRKLLARDLKIQKTFIILFAHVERRRERFNELRLADESLERRVLLLYINGRDFGNECLDANIVRALEVARNPPAQIRSFANIKDAPVDILHDVHSRGLRKFLIWYRGLDH